MQDYQQLDSQIAVERAITVEAAALVKLWPSHDGLGVPSHELASCLASLAILVPQLNGPGVLSQLPIPTLLDISFQSAQDSSLKVSHPEEYPINLGMHVQSCYVAYSNCFPYPPCMHGSMQATAIAVLSGIMVRMPPLGGHCLGHNKLACIKGRMVIGVGWVCEADVTVLHHGAQCVGLTLHLFRMRCLPPHR